MFNTLRLHMEVYVSQKNISSNVSAMFSRFLKVLYEMNFRILPYSWLTIFTDCNYTNVSL